MIKALIDLSLDLSVEDFPGKMGYVASRIGIQDTIVLLDKIAGLELYIPLLARDHYIKKYVRDHYDGFNALSIAVKFGINAADVKKFAKDKSAITDPLSSSHIKIVAEECGRDLATRIIMAFPGERIQIPADYSFLKRIYIQRNFNGQNTANLSVLLHCTDRFVRQVVEDMYEAKRNPQISFLATL